MTRGRAIIEVHTRLGNYGYVYRRRDGTYEVGKNWSDNEGVTILAESMLGWEDCLAQLDNPAPPEVPADGTPT